MKAKTTFSILFQMLGWLLPSPLQRYWLQVFLGWEIGKGSKIGLSIILADKVTVGSGCRIGHCNFAKNIRLFQMGNGCTMLSFNQIAGAPYEGWPAELIVEDSVMITSRHFLDASGRIIIGEGTTIGGREIHFWTHTLRKSPKDEIQLEWGQVLIGKGSYLGARSTLVLASIPENSIVGAGALVVKDHSNEKPGARFLGKATTSR